MITERWRSRDEIVLAGTFKSGESYTLDEGLSYVLEKEYGRGSWIEMEQRYQNRRVICLFERLYTFELKYSYVRGNEFRFYIRELTEQGYKFFSEYLDGGPPPPYLRDGKHNLVFRDRGAWLRGEYE